MRHHRLTPALLIASVALLSSCGGDSLLEADADIAFLVGDWDATRFVVQSKANPEVHPDLIGGLGAKFSVNVQPSGQYTAILVYQGNPFTEIGLISIQGGDIIFHVSFPEPATNRSKFTSPSSGRLTLVGDTEFQFIPGAEPQPAIATIDIKKR